MTREELETKLETLGCQVFYNHTTRKDQVTLPFIVYMDTDTNNQFADNKVCKKIISYLAVIYSAKRDSVLEGNLEAIFDANMIPYEISGFDWDEDLNMWQVTYQFDLVD